MATHRVVDGQANVTAVVWVLLRLADACYTAGDAPRWVAGRLIGLSNRIVERQRIRRLRAAEFGSSIPSEGGT